MTEPASSPVPEHSVPEPDSATTKQSGVSELKELRERVAALERAIFPEDVTGPNDGSSPATDERRPVHQSSVPDALSGPDSENLSPFWALETLRAQVPEPGAVMLVGSVTAPNGQTAKWQYGTVVDDIFGSDFSSRAEAMSALAHPVRLRILQHLLSGAETVQDLTTAGEFGTSGQIYHHLKILVSAGWLSAGPRSRYSVPAERLVPLLVMLTGATR